MIEGFVASDGRHVWRVPGTYGVAVSEATGARALPAEEGASSTAGMVSRKGRPTKLGGRSRGYKVSGAGSMLYALRQAGEALSEWRWDAGRGQIMLNREDFEATYRRAQMIRSRYTVFGLANETGILDGCVEDLFSPGGFWARGALTQAT